MKNIVFRLLEDSEKKHFAQSFVNSIIIGLIILNSFAVALATVDSYKVAYKDVFDAFEIFSVAFFTLEYILRVWASLEDPSGRYSSPFLGRLRYILSPMAIIDLIAFLPFYLSTFFGVDLRILRLFRLLRLVKLTRYSPDLKAV